MAQDLTFRGVAYATGPDPADRIIVTAVITISGATETALAASLGAEHTASCVVVSVNYTRASTEVVTPVASPGSVTVTFGSVQPGSDTGERTCSALIPAYGPALYTGTAYCVVFDDVVPYAAPPTGEPDAVVADGLWGRYYNNPDLTGLYVAQRKEVINFEPFTAGNKPAGVNTEYFSARWSGKIESPVTGGVQFRGTFDDLFRLYIDGRLYIDKWAPARRETSALSQTIEFVSGVKRPIWVEFSDSGGDVARARLEWKYPGQDWQVVPLSALYSGEGELPPLIPPLKQSRVSVEVINRYPEA